MQNGILKLLLLILTCSVTYSCNKEKTRYSHKEISSNWKFKNADDSLWYEATVPGCVHTDLLNNSIIEDPYYRLNERDVQWVDKKDWEYSTTFKIDKNTLDKDVVELDFKGLDTYANVFLNDSLILEANNMFISWRVSCKKHLKECDNTLRIIFESPITVGLHLRDLLGYQLPGAENDQSELGGLGDKKVCVFTRKPGYHFGWDWGPRLVTSGIWQEIELIAWDIANIQDLFIIQKEITKKKATLQVEIEIEATEEAEVSMVTLIDNEVCKAQKVSLLKGLNNITFSMDILNPELWWTNGLGDQKLYDIDILVKDNFKILSTKSTSIGLRTIEIVQEPDSVGKSFYFKLNGYPVFMKGANYIPQDIFLNRVTDEDYIKLIGSSKKANYNMLRVWGGGIYEKDIFYNLCDEAGILVWQDFMFACAMYPGNPEFVENVEIEARQNVKRLRNHPCIALWCGDNEILSAWNRWGWKENVSENQGQEIVDTIWKAYDDIFHNILPKVVKELNPQTYYWSSSPSSGFGELENGKSGDNHYWGVWWAKEPFSKYEEEIPRFMSEFGFQSFPEFNSVKKYTIEDDWDIYSEVMQSHQRSSIGNVTIEEYMLRDYNNPRDFEMFLYVGQLLQARGISIGIEAHRRNMPYCMGSLYWQLNDCWPVASWSGIDYYGNWKALHYAVRDAFKETIISNSIENDKLEMYIISDKLENTVALLDISVMDFKGNIINSIQLEIEIQGNSSQAYYHENIKDLIGDYKNNEVLLHSILTKNDTVTIDENIKYFDIPKNLDLPIPNINLDFKEIDEYNYSITISTDVLAKNLYLQSKFEGHFNDNYFDMLPNQRKVVYFTSKDIIGLDSLVTQLTVVTLVDSY